jgi:bifunctional UDP-N-acetylglucosamine pyrophosphorylase/glucosamine-1-phosphate N-acetyltransferase
MTVRPLRAVILGAGLGTRMKSSLPKVMHTVVGRPMIAHVVDRARSVGADEITVVTGHGRELVESWLTEAGGNPAVQFRVQERMLGTADAVRSAIDTFADGAGNVLILYGDVPNLPADELERVVATHAEGSSALTLLSALDDVEHGYGRIVRSAEGEAERIVEYRDATESERALREVNVGVYCVEAAFLVRGLAGLDAENAAGEFYLTDLVAMAAAEGRPAQVVRAETIAPLHGVNTRVQLAEAERIARDACNHRWMLAGVTIRDPATVWIDATVTLGRDVTLESGVCLRGNTRLDDGVYVEAGVRLEDVHVPAGTRVAASPPRTVSPVTV